MAELQRQNALAAQVTVASVTEMYLEIYRGAMSAKEYPPAATAVTGITKLHGLVIDRQQIEAVIRKPSFDPNADATMSEAEWFESFGSVPAIDYQAEPQTEPGMDSSSGRQHSTHYERRVCSRCP